MHLHVVAHFLRVARIAVLSVLFMNAWLAPIHVLEVRRALLWLNADSKSILFLNQRRLGALGVGLYVFGAPAATALAHDLLFRQASLWLGMLSGHLDEVIESLFLTGQPFNRLLESCVLELSSFIHLGSLRNGSRHDRRLLVYNFVVNLK